MLLVHISYMILMTLKKINDYSRERNSKTYDKKTTLGGLEDGDIYDFTNPSPALYNLDNALNG